MKKVKIMIASILIATNIMTIPVYAEYIARAGVEARYNNISTALLNLGFDRNNVAYCNISITPFSNCTGMEGYMRLLDSNGQHVASWNVYDYTEPYMIEKTAQVQYGQTYTLTLQGYAYGTGQLFDDIVLSVTATCTD